MARVVLRDVRLAFPELFEATQYQGQGPFTYRVNALLPKGSEGWKKFQAEVKNVVKEKWGEKAEQVYKQILANPKQCCFADGDLKDYAGYPGNWVISCSRAQKDGPPAVVDRNRTLITASAGLIYSGVYANVSFDLWAQDNKFGKGVRAGLVSVQFVKHGESFGGAAPSNANDFDDLGFDDDGFGEDAPFDEDI